MTYILPVTSGGSGSGGSGAGCNVIVNNNCGSGTGTGSGSGVAEPWARVAGNATIYAQRKIATAVREAAGIYKITRTTPASVSPTGKIEMGCDVTISGVAGDGSAGSSPFKSRDSHVVVQTDTTAGVGWGVSQLTNKIIVFGSNTNNWWIHNLANFTGTPTQVSANGQPINGNSQTVGVVSREGKYAWASGKAADSSSLRCLDIETEVSTSFGGTVDRFAVAAEDNAGSPAVYVVETSGGVTLKRYNPNVGTATLGAAIWTTSIDITGDGQMAVHDVAGFLWFEQGGLLYQVDKASGAYTTHRYPTELGTGSVGGNSTIGYDRFRRRLYMILRDTTTGPESNYGFLYEGANWNTVLQANSVKWNRLAALPAGTSAGTRIHYDEGEDVIFIVDGATSRAYRYSGDPKVLIDTVSVDDTTSPDNPEVDYDTDGGTIIVFYSGQYGYLTVVKSGLIYILRISYKGAILSISGAGGTFTRPLNWAYEIISTTEARIFTYLNQSPPIFVDCEFTVHLPDLLDAGGVGGGGGEATHQLFLPFAFGDATPSIIGSVGANKQIVSVQVFITTAFNGTGAALSVGTLALPTDLMLTTENNPAVVGEYSIYTQKTYGANTQLFLHITPGAGASAGTGFVIVEYQP